MNKKFIQILVISVLAFVFINSFIYEWNYSIGTILWLSIGALFLIYLPFLLFQKTNKYFKKNKFGIIFIISLVCLLDTLSTYSFIKIFGISSESNVFQRILIHFFGVNLGLFIMLIFIILMLCLIISKTKYPKEFFIIVIILKLFISFMNLGA